MISIETPVGVVPVLIGPLQALIAILPGLLAAMGGAIAALFKPETAKKLIILIWSQKVPVAVVVAVIIGGCQLLPVAKNALGLKGEGSVSSTEWLAFRGGPQRTGNACPDDPDPTSGGINWKHAVQKKYYSSPTVIPKMKDGKSVGAYVYAVSARKELVKDQGTIFCIDSETGQTEWEWSEKSYRATFSSPAVSGKYLVVGEGLHFTRDARIICLDIEKVEKVWEFRTGSHVESSPCISGGKVYVGAGDDGYYCFKLEPDTAGKPEEVWHLEGDDYPDAETSPVVVDGRVYFGLGMGGKAICCVDAETGEEYWRVKTPYSVFSAPTIMDGKLFFGMGNGNYIQGAGEVRALEIAKMQKAGMSAEKIKEEAAMLGPAGEVWRLDLKDFDEKTGQPKVKWKTDVERTVLGTVAARDGRIYFGSRNKYFYCLNAETGVVIKKWNARGPIVTGAALGSAHVFFVVETGMLYGLDLEAFEPVLQVNLGNNGPYMSSPALGNGRVFVGSSGAGLICAGQAGYDKDLLWAGRRGGPGASGYGGGGILPLGAQRAWDYPTVIATREEDEKKEGETKKTILTVTAPVVYQQGSVYVGVNTEKEFGLRQLIFDTKIKKGAKQTKRRRRTRHKEGWFFKTPNRVSLSAAVSARYEKPAKEGDVGMFVPWRVYCVDGRSGDAGRNLYCLSAEGDELWRRPIAAGVSGRILLTQKEILVEEKIGSLTCLDRKKSETNSPVVKWQEPLGECQDIPFVHGDIFVALVQASEPLLQAHDLETGDRLWKTEIDGKPRTGCVVAKYHVDVEVENDASPEKASDVRITCPSCKKKMTVSVVHDDKKEEKKTKTETHDLVLVGMDGGINAYDLITGKKVWSVSCGSSATELVVGDDFVTCINDQGELIVVDVAKGKIAHRIAEAAPCSPPLVSEDKIIYFGKLLDIQILELSKKPVKPRRWMKAKWMGQPTAPLAGADSHVFFATQKKGLICARSSRR
ncbi:MAG: PQQ-binding-like beta-propeller repeat protein [Kiritimatiellae bacterium]|nr:PQQ-binding-like beta-propeller repeat protein [Kiritimatiellia bacterium]